MIRLLQSSLYRSFATRTVRSKEIFVFRKTPEQRCPLRSLSSSSWKWSKSSAEDVSSTSSIISTSSSDNASDAIPVSAQNQILETCAKLHASIMPINSKLNGPLAKHSDKGTSLPFVFLVGNHSSGKSSFINYVLGRKIQTAGVAPTDDCFTIIAPGPDDTDQDGPALIGDPDMVRRR